MKIHVDLSSIFLIVPLSVYKSEGRKIFLLVQKRRISLSLWMAFKNGIGCDYIQWSIDAMPNTVYIVYMSIILFRWIRCSCMTRAHSFPSVDMKVWLMKMRKHILNQILSTLLFDEIIMRKKVDKCKSISGITW